MFGKISTVAVLLVTLAAPVCTAEKHAKEKILSLGYNALEAAISQSDAVRTRLFTDVNIGKKFQISYSGLNETDNLDPQKYFGKHVLAAGGGGWTSMPEIVLKTDAHGVKSAHAGVKNTSIPKALGGYGWTEANAGKEGGAVAMFYGRKFGHVGIEVMHSETFPYGKKPDRYTELQPFAGIGKECFVFGRAEINGADFGKGKYMLGLGKKF